MKYLIVGAGLSGCVAAMKLHDLDKKAQIDIVERRAHIGGNCFSEERDGIAVHLYGPHIFHTDDKKLWDWFTKRCPLVPYSHQVKAQAPNLKIYSLPFSLQTAYEMFNTRTFQQFEEIKQHEIDTWKEDHKLNVENVEGFAISRLGTTMYRNLIRGYTEKQWGCDPARLPASIVGRLPIRNTYDVGYYAHRYVGIPKDEKGYMPFFEKVRKVARVFEDCEDWRQFAETEKYDAIIYTGAVDEYFDYKYGEIEYRTSTWEYEDRYADETTGMAVLNYPDRNVMYTRRIEYRYLQGECNSDRTYVAYEFSEPYKDQKAGPMYVVPTEENMRRVQKYSVASQDEEFCGAPVLFLGRLAQSKYLDMNTTIENAFEKVPEFFAEVLSRKVAETLSRKVGPLEIL